MQSVIDLSLSKRSQRERFKSEVGARTYNVIRDTLLGSATPAIAARHHVSKATVAAIRANLTRGSYLPFAGWDNNTATGLCEFGG